MYLRDFSSGDYDGESRRWCWACRQPIYENEPSTSVETASVPTGLGGLTGEYHVRCSRPFASLACALDMLSRFGRLAKNHQAGQSLPSPIIERLLIYVFGTMASTT